MSKWKNVLKATKPHVRPFGLEPRNALQGNCKECHQSLYSQDTSHPNWPQEELEGGVCRNKKCKFYEIAQPKGDYKSSTPEPEPDWGYEGEFD